MRVGKMYLLAYIAALALAVCAMIIIPISMKAMNTAIPSIIRRMRDLNNIPKREQWYFQRTPW